MAERAEYAPGTFSWVDLATTDQDGAKRFYAAVFGWEYDDQPVMEGVVYSMAQLEGLPVAAISPMPEMLRSSGAPPAWMSYVTVTDADALAARAGELRAQVVGGPFDVFTAGRMAVLRDPEGAVFSVWQPREHIGARRVNEPGALTWNELATRDVSGARRFYGDLFGWTFEGPEDQYVVIRNGERSNGGLRPMSPAEEGIPPYWVPYFAVADVEALAASATEHGGGVLAGPTEVPAGRFVALHDPQRAAFAVFDGTFDE
jgi:predicted enzyme related to lactoylglutathione lyase